MSILARSYFDKKELTQLTGLIENGTLELAVVQKGLVRAKASQTAEASLGDLLA